jgi:hypothetical protein
MTTANFLANANVFNNNSNAINGVFDKYKVSISVNTPIINGDKVNVTFPPEIAFPLTDPTCIAEDNLINVTCQMNSGRIIIATLNSVNGGIVA